MKHFRSRFWFQGLFSLAGFLVVTAMAPAFSPPVATEGPLTIRIADPGEVKALDKPIAVPVTLTNAGDAPLAGTVRVWGVDGWRAEGDATRKFSLPPKGTETIPFAVVPATNSYAALYPVHAQAEFGTGKSKKAAHAILILSVAQEAVTKAAPSQLRLLRAPRRGPLRLDVDGGYQARIAVHDKPPVAKPVGWRGSDAATGGSVSISDADRGERRRAFNVHPPYRAGWGDLWMDWRVALPKAEPIVLEFATAIRDSDAKREGASDGVDFRVQVSTGDEFDELFARFSAAKHWEPARVDLSKYAGCEVTLRLVAGPGPKHNTSCDSSFWAEPTVWVGAPVVEEPADRRAARRQA
ncbi:MAG: hypothetical protein HZA91_09935, partial [Verrucomicrobia bacterium]|nr:hypothetical protein [Verrucomicrobiota bacterium]